MLKQRVITAAILIPLVLLAIFYLPERAFQVMAAAIMLACAWEWTNLMHMRTTWERIVYLAIILLCLVAVIWIAMGYFLYAVLVGIIGLGVVVHRYQASQAQFKLGEIAWYIIGVVMFVACWYSLCIIRYRVGGSAQLLTLLLIVWTADTAAYFSGKYFGKNKLASFVSPNKTWEGFKGAAIAVFVLTLIEAMLYKMTFAAFLATLFLNALTFIAAVYGDLFESMMKRMADCKDSGGLLPGHGGLLDRLDSLFFAAPCYAAGLLLMTIYYNNY